jgi:hypothetical protein
MKIALSIIVSILIGGLIGFVVGQTVRYDERSVEQTAKSYGELVTELRAKEILSIYDMVKLSVKMKTVDEGGLFHVKNVHYLTGTIENIALATAVRDVRLKVDFLSKTKTVISSEELVIYDIVGPSRAKDFKEKISMPEKAKDWEFTLMDIKTD